MYLHLQWDLHCEWVLFSLRGTCPCFVLSLHSEILPECGCWVVGFSKRVCDKSGYKMLVISNAHVSGGV